jgi:hypothetical protein
VKKSFRALNEFGIEMNYTVLSYAKRDSKNYVIYTNNMPSDNDLGVRILVSEIVNEEPFEIKRINNKLEKEITEEFIMEMIRTGKELKKK